MAQEITDIKKIVQLLRKNFKYNMPWMFLFFVYKQDQKHYLFHHLISLPIIDAAIDNGRLVLTSHWSGDNTSDFVFKRKKTDNITEVLGSEKDQINLWSEVKSLKYGDFNSPFGSNHFDQTSKIEDRKYNASSKIMLRHLAKIDIYKWGFEIITHSPIDVFAVTAKYLRKGLGKGEEDAHDSIKELEQKVSQWIGEEFILPYEIVDPASLLYYWSPINTSISDAEINKILEPNKKVSRKRNKIKDIGQKTGKYIMLE